MAKVVEMGASCLTTGEEVGSRASVSNTDAAEARTDDGKLAADNTTFEAVVVR